MEGTHNNSGKHDYPIRKDSGSARTIQKIRQLFLTGHSFTARELNVLAGLDEVRKVIPVLRNMGGLAGSELPVVRQTKGVPAGERR